MTAACTQLSERCGFVGPLLNNNHGSGKRRCDELQLTGEGESFFCTVANSYADVVRVAEPKVPWQPHRPILPPIRSEQVAATMRAHKDQSTPRPPGVRMFSPVSGRFRSFRKL